MVILMEKPKVTRSLLSVVRLWPMRRGIVPCLGAGIAWDQACSHSERTSSMGAWKGQKMSAMGDLKEMNISPSRML